MATLRSNNSVLDRYRSISRPSLNSSGGGLSSNLSSLAKKQQAAEDDIIDNQYAQGTISAETYQAALNNRLTRSTLTPLQRVNIQQKIEAVATKVMDAQVDTAYAKGELDTASVLNYEKQKLAQIPEVNSVAYQQQAQKVQQLTDKLEKEKRTQFRVAENLRISRMPEDTSERLLAKAQLYEKLEAQARIDGDNQQADTFATNKNNYIQSAKRAGVNDLITSARGSISETPSQGLGVPNADSGLALFQKMLGLPSSAPSTAVGNQTSTGEGVVQGRSGSGLNISGTTPAIKNAFEALDRTNKRLENLYQSQADKQTLINSYEEAIAQATGDQKTTLQIALNNLVDSKKQIDNDIEIATQDIYDKVTQIQEKQAAAAQSAFRKQASQATKDMAQKEFTLENKLRTGKITKDEYLRESLDLINGKIQLLQDIADGYRAYGDDTAADKIEQTDIVALENTPIAKLTRELTGLVANETDPNKIQKILNDNIIEYQKGFELYRVDKTGTLDDLTSKARNKGDISFKDFTTEKADGTFNQRYINDNGVYTDLHLGGEVDPLTGNPLSLTKKRENLLLGKGTQPYYFDAKGQKKPAVIITYKNANNETITIPQTKEFVEKSKNMFVPEKVTGVNNTKQDSQVLYAPRQIATPGKPFQPLGAFTPDFSRIPKVLKGEEPFIPKGSPFDNKNLQTVAKNVFKQQSITDFIPANIKKSIGDTIGNITSSIGKFFTPQAEAAYKPETKTKVTTSVAKPNRTGFVEGTPDQYKSLIIKASDETGIPTNIISALLKQESGFNPNAASPAGAKGIAQFMPGTAKAMGINPLDPKQAITGAAKYLKQNLDKFGGDISKALAAYNAGAGAVSQYGGIPPYAETQNYVKKILADSKKTFGSEVDFPENIKAPEQPKVTVTPTVTPAVNPALRSQPAKVATPTPTSTPKVIAPVLYTSKRDANKDGTVQWGESVLGSAVNQGISAVKNFLTPQPAFKSPIPSVKIPQVSPLQTTFTNLQKTVTPVVKNVQKAATPIISNVQKTVSSAVNNVGSFINNLLNPKKKK